MRSCQLLIVAGGGQLDDYWGGPWGHPYALFKWTLLARLTESEVVFLGVGTGTLDSNLSKFFIKHALTNASHRSYRDYGSRVLLENITFTKNDLVFPDIAFGYTPKITHNDSGKSERKCVVGISPIAYLSKRWPKTNNYEYEDYILHLCQFAAQLIEDGYKIVLFNSSGYDIPTVDEVLRRLNQDGIVVGSSISVPPIQTLDQLIFELNGIDLVVASRLHGVLLAHCLKRPVLAISYDRKVVNHMNDMMQEKYCINISELDQHVLMKTFESIETNRNHIVTELENILLVKRNALNELFANILCGDRHYPN
jgi:polysaccharide pyruvyl transferase WcaK-like protein